MDYEKIIEVFKLVSLFAIPILFLGWNILNEINVWRFWNIGGAKYIKLWHKYDAILRATVFPLAILSIGGFSELSLKVFFTFVILYRPIFNTGFNYGKIKAVFKHLKFVDKLLAIFYLSDGSSIDRFLIKCNKWLVNLKWLKKYNIQFQFFNFILMVVEFSIAIIIWTIL